MIAPTVLNPSSATSKAPPGSSFRDRCPNCPSGRFSEKSETAMIPSNVREFKDIHTRVWRCPSCASIHSLERLDMDAFYANYPFNHRQIDLYTRIVYSFYIKRLKKLGMNQNDRILDYGCGSGILLDCLKNSGFKKSQGYDPYTPGYMDEGILSDPYDTVMAQDVIEHVEDPQEFFQKMARLTKKGGRLCIGTPRADAIQLDSWKPWLHSLHQPYHLHIYSESALIKLAAKSGFQLQEIRRTHILDTPLPFVNWAFIRHLLSMKDNTLDAGFEAPSPWQFLSPKLIALGILGRLFPQKSEMIVIFKRQAE